MRGARGTSSVSRRSLLGQLPLALMLEDHASFDTFVAGSNAAAVEQVRSLAGGDADTVWLWGAEGAGKSHLLQAACRAATAAGRRAMYVALPAASPAILADLEQVEVLAIDDVHTIAGELAWEQPLFVILNAFSSRNGALLLAANAPAAQCAFRVADLRIARSGSGHLSAGAARRRGARGGVAPARSRPRARARRSGGGVPAQARRDAT